MSDQRPENSTADDAIARLREGNARYVGGSGVHPNCDPGRRAELAGGQRPFASIVTCADSRVAPEIVFDQGLGDLFVCRVAGNISGDTVLGSLEYASAHLGVNLIVVMGHRSCGAVAAAVDNVDVDGPATHSHIDSLIAAIRPAVRAAGSAGGDLLDESIRENARRTAQEIGAAEPILAQLAASGVRVVPAYYDLGSGEVSWL